MDKLKSLPARVLLAVDIFRSQLEQALGRDDVPQDLQDQLAHVCQGLGALMEIATEAAEEGVGPART
jgi:hypothetical protein